MMQHCPDGYTINKLAIDAGKRTRRNAIARARRQYGSIKVQDSYHGIGHYSVQIFAADRLVVDLNLTS